MFKKLLLFMMLMTFPSVALAQGFPPLGIQDEGGTISRPVTIIDCVGAGVACTFSVNKGILTIGGGGGTAALFVNLPVQSAKLTGESSTVTISGCDASTQGAQIDAGGGDWKLLFDATTDESGVWIFPMPNNYSSDPLLDIIFSMASGESNEVQFEGAIRCVTPTTDTEVIDQADWSSLFSNCAVGTPTTVSATAGESYLQTVTLNDDSCAADDWVAIFMSTDANDATNDDASGDREVIGLNLNFSLMLSL